MSVVSTMLMLSILSTAFGYVAGVLMFEFRFETRPPLTNSLRDAAWETQMSIIASENNLRSILADANLPNGTKANMLEANLAASTRAIESFSAKIDHLAMVAAANDDSIVGSFLTSRRALLVLSGLFVAIVLKLLIELYKYNSHLRSHYVAVSDALLLDEGRFSPATFERTMGVVSPQGLRIGAVRSGYETLVQHAAREKGDAKCK